MKFHKDKRYTCAGFPYVNLLTDAGDEKTLLLGYYINDRGVKNIVFHDQNGLAKLGAAYLDLKETTKYGHIKTDDKVMVRDTDFDSWTKRYFSHEDNGKAYCFDSGATSWSCGDVTQSYWEQCLTLAEYEKIIQENK